MPLRCTRRLPETSDLGFPHLYREDLEQIASILLEECDQLEILFHDNSRHVGDRPEDFSAAEHLPEVLDRVTITGKRGEVSLTVELGSRSQIVMTNPDNGIRGAARAVEALCRDRRRRWVFPAPEGSADKYTLTAVRIWTVAIVLATFFGIPIFWQAATSDLERLLLTVIPGLAALTAMALQLTYSRAHTMIINAPRAQRPTHWQGYRGMYLGALLGGFIGYVVNQIPSLN